MVRYGPEIAPTPMTALRALIAIGLSAFWLALCVPPMFMSPPRAVTGIHAIDDGSVFVPNRVRVDPGSPAYRAGLRTGDVLGCLSIRDHNVLLSLGPQGYAAGSPITTCVRRHNKIQSVAFVARTGSTVPEVYGSKPLAALRVGVVLVFLLTGIALVMLKPGLSTWLFFAYALGNAPSFAVQQNATAYGTWQYGLAFGVTNWSTAVAVVFLLLFAVVVPDDAIPRGWRRAAFAVTSILAIADIVFVLIAELDTRYTLSFNASYAPDEILTVLTVIVVVARIFTMERSERARFGWAAFGIMFGVVVNDLRNTLSGGSFQMLSTAAADLTVVMPICLLYAILKRHVIDVRFAMSRTVVYAVLTTIVIGVVGAVDWLTSAYLREARVAMALDALATIGIAFALNRVHRWMENTVDFLLFRRKYQAELFLRRLGRTLLSASQEETIDRALVRDTYERLDLTFAALFRNTGTNFVLSFASSPEIGLASSGFEYDHDLVRFLATERTRLSLGDLTHHAFGQSSTALPIFEGRELTGFAVYGVHHDGTNLDPDEIETLERLCEAAAQAYTYIEVSRYRTERAQLVPSGAAI